MTLLRIELLRFMRTRLLIPLVAVFVLTGLAGPLLVHYLPELAQNQTSENIQIIVTAPKPSDGIDAFSSNAGQLGLLVAVIVAAGVLALDAKPGLSAFYRTRVRPVDRVILPRYVVSAAAVSISYVLGALAAWYETTVLIGGLDAGRYLVGIGFTIIYFWFAIAVVSLAASLTRSVVGTAALAVGVLLVLPIAGAVGRLHPWLPSTLLGAQVGMAAAVPAGDFARATITTVVVAAAVLVASLWRFRVREI